MLLDMAYRLLREFRQAFTRLDTPPFSNRRHPDSGIARVAEWVEQGPDLARDGVVRWRCVDLQERIGREWGVSLYERTVGKLLRKPAFQRLSVRPQHRNSDPAAQALFRMGSLAL